MKCNIGKIIEYDNYVGNILDESGNKYMFLSKDLNDKSQLGDYVVFNSENVDDKNRAFFIENINNFMFEDGVPIKIKKHINNKEN